MASLCRSAAAIAAARSAVLRPKTLLPKPQSSRRSIPLISRSATPSALGATVSLMPLHTATATARLRSNIAADSSCWSWLSQDFAIPR